MGNPSGTLNDVEFYHQKRFFSTRFAARNRLRKQPRNSIACWDGWKVNDSIGVWLTSFAQAIRHPYSDGMAETSIQKLLHLLGPDQPQHVRTAAALVLGELGDRDGDISAALCELLNDPDLAVRIQGIMAVGRL